LFEPQKLGYLKGDFKLRKN